MTAQEASEAVLNGLKRRNYSPRTVKAYAGTINDFICMFEDEPMESLDYPHVQEYHLSLIDKGLAPRSINQKLSSIRYFFRSILRRPLNYDDTPNMKLHRTFPDVLTSEEMSMLESRCENSQKRAIALILFGSGLRVSELVNLKTTDIDSNNMRIMIRQGKGAKDRYTLLPEAGLLWLRRYWVEFKPGNKDSWLFPSTSETGHITAETVEKWISQAAAQAGIAKKVTPHTLRHSFATALLNDGASINDVRRLLGHSSIRATLTYVSMAKFSSGLKSPADSLAKPQDRRGEAEK
jgi:site-specific recombinase XerD